MTPLVNIAFFTGQSDPGNAALSPLQAAFLAQLDGPRRALVPCNFPYGENENAPRPHRHTPLLRASWNNTRQYFASRRPAFSAAHRDAVSALVERGGDACRTVFLAGSCGLELFNNLRLPPALEARCVLICYGPVARRLPAHARTLVAQGRGDFLSRAFFRHRDTLRLRCGHLDYLRDPDFLKICQCEITRLTHTCNSISA